MERPIRLYKHTYCREATMAEIDRRGRDVAQLEFVRSGGTPCQAKRAAFVALETKLVADNLPRDGWRLTKQVDVTHLAVVR